MGRAWGGGVLNRACTIREGMSRKCLFCFYLSVEKCYFLKICRKVEKASFLWNLMQKQFFHTKEVSIVLRFLKIKNKFRRGGCIKTPLESSVYQLRELRHLKLPALCVWVQIVVLEIGVNNISFVVPLLIGKVFREDIVWLFSTTKIKKK